MFDSSPEILPLKEQATLPTTTPYGRSNLITEDMLHDLPATDKFNNASPWGIALLLNFNPVSTCYANADKAKTELAG